jgi:hypothetical protein
LLLPPALFAPSTPMIITKVVANQLLDCGRL